LAERTGQRASWNPFEVSGTALPPNALIAAKFVTIVFLGLNSGVAALPGHFLPFVSVFQHAGSPALFRHILQAIFGVAAAGLLLNRWVRTNCFVMSGVIAVAIASSRVYYLNNRLYLALLLVMLALYDRRIGTRLLRYQIAVLYTGAAANKLLQADWRDGHFVQAWLPHYFPGYVHLANALPHLWLSIALGWIAMLTEVTLVFLILTRRLVPLAAWVGVAYHTGLTTVTQHTFDMFWYSMFASYVIVMPWPAGAVRVSFVEHSSLQRSLARALRWLDIENRYQPQLLPVTRLTVEESDTSFVGPGAWVRLLLYLPVAYFVFAFLLATVRPARELIPLVFLCLAALAWPKLFKSQRSACTPARSETTQQAPAPV
jgi:hypothetical protein